jgi:hypothetical protein
MKRERERERERERVREREREREGGEGSFPKALSFLSLNPMVGFRTSSWLLVTT